MASGSNQTLLFIIIAVIVSVILYVVIRFGRSAIEDQRQRQVGDETSEQPVLGLKPSDVEAFPTFIYRATTKDDENKDTINQNGNCDGNRRECSICLSELEEEDVVRELLPCRHFFHVPCIDAWLYKHPSCPICREKLRAEMVVKHEESMSPPLPHFHPFKRMLSKDVHEANVEIRIEIQPEMRESMFGSSS